MVDRREFVGSLLALAAVGPERWLGMEGGDAMFGLIGSMVAHPGQRDTLMSILVEATTSLPGCLSYIVAADAANEEVIWVTEVWESQQAHEASLTLPGVREAIDRARPLLAAFGQRIVTRPVGGVGLGSSHGSGAALRDPVAPVEDRVVALDAVVGLSVAETFRHFTEPALLQRWLAPRANVGARVGGAYELFWQPDDPENNSTIGCRITALAPDQLVAFQWRSPVQFKGFANGADPLTHVVVTFHQEASGTRIRLVHSGWRSGAAWEEARAWQERAWRAALQSLEELVGGTQVTRNS